MISLKKFIAIAGTLILVSFSTFALIPAAHADAPPTTYVVNSVGDASDLDVNDVAGACDTGNTIQGGAPECTLRAAIEQSNLLTSEDTIEFDIPNSGVQTITLTSPLPTIQDTLKIDGYSQTGASQNTAVSPAPINAVITIAIDADQNNALVSSASGTEIHGLSIFDCSTCISSTGSHSVIQGNFVGVDPTGLSTGGAFSNTAISFTQTDGAVVGGTNPQDRNVITGGIGNGPAISLIQSTNSVVLGNYIGIGVDGESDFGSKAGIFMLQSPDTTIGSANSGGNIISGLEQAVICVLSSHLVFQGNFVGVDSTGQVNDNIENIAGLVIELGSNDTLIGGDGIGEGNVIAGVKGVGVTALSATSEVGFGGTIGIDRVAMLGNSIYDIDSLEFPIFGDSNQGIDLLHFEGDAEGQPLSFDLQGVTENDVAGGDSDSGPNGLINFPTLTSAIQVGNQLTVNYDIDAAGSPSDDYRVEFFANDKSTIFGHGPGQTYLGSDVVQNGSHVATLTLPNGLDVTSKSLSATLTAIDLTSPTEYGATSEFSQNILIGSDVDSDADTIPDSIEDAAPNGGDGNDDGIADSEQSTVSSFVSATAGVYTTFVTERRNPVDNPDSGCYSNGFVDSIASDSIDTSDTGFDYPYGLTNFSLNCSRGDTVTIDKYIFTDTTDVQDLSIRKYDPISDSFISAQDVTDSINNAHIGLNISDPEIEATTIGGESALHLTYTLMDGELGDDDGEVNGVIVDPVGLAQVHVDSQQVSNGGSNGGNSSGSNSTSANGTLATTGAHELKTQYDFAKFLAILGIFLVAAARRMNKSHIPTI